MLELQTLKYKNLRLRQSRYTKLSHNLEGIAFNRIKKPSNFQRTSKEQAGQGRFFDFL